MIYYYSQSINIIVIVCDNLTPSVKEAVRLLNENHSIFVQVFPIRNLMYNVIKHQTVPEHIRIKKADYQVYLDDFLAAHHINTLDNLPKILDSDPVSMFIGLRPGEICKIIRPSISAGKHIVYRYCVADK